MMIKLNIGCVEIIDLSINEYDLTSMPCHSLLEDIFYFIGQTNVLNILDLQFKYH